MNLSYFSWSILGRIRAWVGGLMVLKAVGSSWCFVCIAAADLTNGEYGVSRVSELTSSETCNEQLGYTRCGTATHHVNRISSEKKTWHLESTFISNLLRTGYYRISSD